MGEWAPNKKILTSKLGAVSLGEESKTMGSIRVGWVGVLASAFLSASCSGDPSPGLSCVEHDDCETEESPDGPASPPDGVEGWAVGSWWAPGNYSPSSSLPAQGLGILADHSWQHNTEGTVDGSGNWTLTGAALSLDGKSIAGMLPNCTAFIWGTDSFPGTVYYRDDLPAGCPSSPEPLTPAEQCLVGRFRIVHNTTFDMGTFVYERKEHRTETMNQYWSDTQTTTVRQWRIKDSKLCRLAPDGYEDCGFVIDWDEVRSSRETSEPPGCEYPDSSPPPPPPPSEDTCDDGVFGTIESAACEDCIQCSHTGALCSDVWDAYVAHSQTPGLQSCLSYCDDCGSEAPCNPPSNCIDVCFADYPGASAALNDALSCGVCADCPLNCDAASNCH